MIIVAIVSASVVQLVALLGAVWSLAGRLARMEATMVTAAICESHRSACALERKRDARAERLDATGSVRLVSDR